MIAHSDLVLAAGIAAIASVTGALIGLLGIVQLRRGNRKVMFENRVVQDALDTGNGHTAGESLARLEDMAWRHEQRIDQVEVVGRETKDVLDDHVAETRELIDDFQAMRPGLHSLIDTLPDPE